MMNKEDCLISDLLADARILVVEDEFLPLLELKAVLADAGAEKVHVCRCVKEALSCIDTQEITGAILDIRLGQESIAPVARALAAQKIPFFFLTGQTSSEPVLKQWPQSKVVTKPANAQTIVAALSEVIGRR
jgi:DNA-binding response OmpR family regulator